MQLHSALNLRLKLRIVCLTVWGASLFGWNFADAETQEGTRIDAVIDARDVSHRIQHADLSMPVRPGPLTLAYAKWIPGEHAPNGPITQLMNLHFEVAGKELEWARDPADAFQIHLDIPSGATMLQVHLDYFSPAQAFGSGFGKSPDVTEDQLILMFNEVLLYPAQLDSNSIEIDAKVKLPIGWSSDSALLKAVGTSSEIVLPRVSLTTLIDSPLIAGRHFTSIPVVAGGTPARLSIASRDESDLQMPHDLLEHLGVLTRETEIVFGPPHYERYAWLLSLNDDFQKDGTEHAESSDVRQEEKLFTDPADIIQWRLFPHEYVHAWNGKYRRPADLLHLNYQQPMIDRLLWVYEGLTRYYGDLVLNSRSGFATVAQSRDYIAYVAAQMAEDRSGRSWRTLEDTAVAIPAYGESPSGWTTVRRGADYYNEMLLIWLEADMVIRADSQNQKSLDDFCLEFFGGAKKTPSVDTYTRENVIEALRKVDASDWDQFFKTRVESIQGNAPLEGLHRSGWQLVFTDESNPFLSDVESLSSTYNFSFSLGFWADSDGAIQDVVPGSVGYDAGLSPGVQIRSINGSVWSAAAARTAILSAEASAAPIQLEVISDRRSRVLKIDYHNGLRYPHLVRDRDFPDVLSNVLKSRTTSQSGQ